MHVKVIRLADSGDTTHLLLRVHRLIRAIMFHCRVLMAYRVDPCCIPRDHHVLRGCHHTATTLVQVSDVHRLLVHWFLLVDRLHYLVVVDLRGVFQTAMVVVVLQTLFDRRELVSVRLCVVPAHIKYLIVRAHCVI